MSDKPKSLDDIDKFWDLNSLLPKKRPVTPSHCSVNTDTVEINVPGTVARDSGVLVPPRDVTRPRGELTMRARAEEYRSRPLDPYLIYTPDSKLIKRVEVSKWDTKFNFYENFRTDAKRFWSRSAIECEHVPFFSYIPQYSQLKYAQLKWYLWWRENVRRGVYLKSDFCYILLYIYEIINCPDLIEPSEAVNLLCDIWLAYRREHRRIDSYMCEWLCDYCLINKLPCPTVRLETILGEITALATLKEFYMDTASGDAAVGVLMHMSTYDFRKSRYVTGDNVSVFSAHIGRAFDLVWNEILSSSDTDGAKEFRIERTAYEGALCVYDMKRSLAIEYVSYTRSPKFRFTVTDIIKYSENKVRMALGIKSRLKVEGLSEDIRECIDRYFGEHLPSPKKARTSKSTMGAWNEREYDKLYEPVRSEFSIENAIKIENDSWQTTEVLTSAFEEAPEAEPVHETTTSHVPEPVPSTEGGDEFSQLINSLDENCTTALTALASGDTMALSGIAKSVGVLADALADRINERAFDIIGDSIIEPCESGYKLIADYEGDIKKWLK